MMEFSILLEACDPKRNIHRAYQLAAGQDLFGDWIVEVTYGRIGSKGRTRTVVVPDEMAAYRYMQDCLKKRESAPKRIGITYKVRRVTGDWKEFQRLGDQPIRSQGNTNTERKRKSHGYQSQTKKRQRGNY